MKNNLLTPFENLPYFTIAGFRQLAGPQYSPAHARIMLSRWAAAGRILPLKKGFYMHRQFFERHRTDPAFSAVVSAILLPQSYLSLEYVLQQHGLLTDITYPVTAITQKNTRTLTNPLGTFTYRSIHPALYHGFHLTHAFGIPYAQASPAKALFDYLYLRPSPPHLLSPHYDLAEDLRLNLASFPPSGRAEFSGYVRLAQPLKAGRKMLHILTNLETHVWPP